MDHPGPESTGGRGRGLLAVAPLVAFALVSVAMILAWAPDPRWGVVVVLPFGFLIGLAWLAFREGD